MRVELFTILRMLSLLIWGPAIQPQYQGELPLPIKG